MKELKITIVKLADHYLFKHILDMIPLKILLKLNLYAEQIKFRKTNSGRGQ